jgi:hypothetical protein
MVCGGSRKWLCLGRFRRNGRQGSHFHGEKLDSAAGGGAGFGQELALMQAQSRCPGRACSYENKPSVTQVREVAFAGQGFGQEVAKFSIQKVQSTSAGRERVEGYALGNLREFAGSRSRWWGISLHGDPIRQMVYEHNLSRKISFNPALY